MLNYMIIVVPLLFVLVALLLTVMLFLSLSKQYQKKFKIIQYKKLKSKTNTYIRKKQSQFILERTRGSVRHAMDKIKSVEDYYLIEQNITYP